MTELAIATETPRKLKREVVKAEPMSLIDLIGAVVTRPDVDVVKVRELLTMQREAEERAEKRAFNEAFNACQKEMLPIVRNAPNGQTKSKYATHDALDKDLRPIYTKHGFGVSFNTADSPLPEHVRVVCYLTHGGAEKTYQTDIPCDGKGARGNDVMTKTHAVGSAMTYGKRYLLALAFNIALVDTDDDGNAAAKPQASGFVSEEQADALLALINEKKMTAQRVYDWVGKKLKAAPPKTVSDIPARLFGEVVAQIKAAK